MPKISAGGASGGGQLPVPDDAFIREDGVITAPPGGGGITPPAGDLGGDTADPTVTGTHLTAPLPLAQGGTGQATAAAALAALLPLTTGGDLLIENATPAPARLPIGSASQVLTVTGGLPAWGAAPSVYQPWQFPLSADGAKGDGKVITDATIAGGALSTLTSASAPFTSADTGKYILVAGAGGSAHQTLVTTVTYVSATSVTLTAAASVAVTNVYAVYGTDDTAAVNSAMTAAYAWWQANSYRQPEILAPAIYMIAGAPVQGGATLGNAQIPFPVPPMSGPRYAPVITGMPHTPGAHYGLNSTPFVTGGAFVCCRTDGTNNVTFGPASVFGTWTHQQGAADSTMSNLAPVFDGVTVILPYPSTYCGVDLYGATGADLDLGVVAWGTPAGMAHPNDSGVFIGKTWVFGLRTPVSSNDGNVKIRNYAFAGLMQGILCGEHVTAESLIGFYCYYGLVGYVDGNGGSMTHGSRISYACVEACYYQMSYIDGEVKLDVDLLDIDQGVDGSGFQIFDPSTVGRGTINVRGLGAVEGRPAVSGGTLLRIRNLDVVPGLQTPPAVPLTTVAQKNDWWQDVWVNVQASGATITTIAVDGTTVTGVTSGWVFLPAGHTITLTYSGGTPTWQWWAR